MSSINSPSRWPPHGPPPSVEGAEISREMLRQRNRFNRGVAGFDVYDKTGNPQAFALYTNNFFRLGKRANRPRTKAEAQGLIRQSFNVQDGTGDSSIDGLPEIDESIMLRKEADAQIYIDGKVTVIKGPDEVKRMQEIIQRLEKTLTILDLNPEETDINALKIAAKRYPNKSSYAIPYGNTYALARTTIGQDIRWLSSPLRIPSEEGAAVSPEREKIFRGYRDELIKLKNTLTTPAMEHQYVIQNGSDTENRRMLEEFCRDPNAVKGAGKFAALLAVGGLLALWGIKDVQKGTLSFGTMILAAGAMFLSKSGPKTAYMASAQFADLSKHLGPEIYENIKKLHPSARNHLIAMLESQTGRAGFPGENDILLLTEPKSRSGKIQANKRIPEEIALKFIGYRGNAGAASVLKRSAKIRDPQGTEIESSLVEANAKSDNARQELNALIK